MCIRDGQRGICKRGGKDVLLIEVAPGLFTGFWESFGQELLLLLLVGPEVCLV